MVPSFDHRPFALALPQGDPMLNDFRLSGGKLQRLFERLFGDAVLLVVFENPAELLESRQLVSDGAAGHLSQARDQSAPLRDRLPKLAGLFQEAPEIDVRLLKIRLEANALPGGVDRAEPIAGLGEGDAVVEIGGVQQRIVGIAANPILVERRRRGRVAVRLQFLRRLEKRCDWPPAAGRRTVRRRSRSQRRLGPEDSRAA